MAVGAVCPLCGAHEGRAVGIRGNREFAGADPSIEPHLVVPVLRCGRCGFYFVDALLREAKALEDEHYGNASFYPGMEASDVDSIRSRLALIGAYVAGRKLLDVGAGKGEFVLGATQVGWTAVGVEPSPSLAQYAREKGADVRTGRLVDQDLPFERFDLVTLLHVLEHVAEPIDFLKSLSRYLSNRGVVFVEVPNCDSNLLRLIDLFYRVTGRGWSARLSPFHPPFHRWGYTANALRYALEQSGYSILRLGTLSGRGRGYGLAGRVRPNRKNARELVSRVLDLCGNRELLYAICRVASPSELERHGREPLGS